MPDQTDLLQSMHWSPISGGTQRVLKSDLEGGPDLISVADVSMLVHWSLDAAPSRAKRPLGASIAPEVSASLDRSLTKHADVWAQLAKY